MTLPPSASGRGGLAVRFRRLVPVGVFALAIGSLLVGCGARSSLRIGWLEAGGPRHKEARYRWFSGLERASIRAETGETIELDYDVDVEKGTLAMTLVDPAGDASWARTFEEDADDTVRIEARQDGRFRLQIEGESTAGRFEIAWRVE